MVAAVEKEMEAWEMGNPLTPQEKLELFGDWLPEEYADEAETDDLERQFAAALAEGSPADGERAVDLAEEHRQLITRRFYDCPPELQAGLGRMYVEDDRSTAHHDRVTPGLAGYVSTACQENAARQA